METVSKKNKQKSKLGMLIKEKGMTQSEFAQEVLENEM